MVRVLFPSLSISGEITLVALAPLTNIALAMKLDPDFGTKLKAVTIMGGNTEGNYFKAYILLLIH